MKLVAGVRIITEARVVVEVADLDDAYVSHNTFKDAPDPVWRPLLIATTSARFNGAGSLTPVLMAQPVSAMGCGELAVEESAVRHQLIAMMTDSDEHGSKSGVAIADFIERIRECGIEIVESIGEEVLYSEAQG